MGLGGKGEDCPICLRTIPSRVCEGEGGDCPLGNDLNDRVLLVKFFSLGCKSTFFLLNTSDA